MGNHPLMHPIHVQSFWIKLITPCLTQLEHQDDDPDAAFLFSFLLGLPSSNLVLGAED